MATYDSWNAAIIAYVMAGAAKGSTIFLSIDEDAVGEIAARFLDEAITGDPVADLVQAVRSRTVQDHRFPPLVNVEGLHGMSGGYPQGVAFLAVMVLAAYRMQEEGGVDESNYFLRLREVLGLPPECRRPDGMTAGAEEPLWLEWNSYVHAAGFQTSAERGEGPQKYLRYACSQAILRESDKDFLQRRFREAGLSGQLDCDQLGFWLSRLQINRRHLRDGLSHPEPAHVWEFYRAAHRLYEGGEWHGAASNHERGRAGRSEGPRNIECGLYRNETLAGDADYALFPRQPGRSKLAPLTALAGPHGPRIPMRVLRPGYYQPVWSQTPFVEKAIEFGVEGDAAAHALLFPRRDFWILTADPENPLGAWATWKPYLDLGEKVLVLVRPGAFDQEMARFRDAKLINWVSRRSVAGWIEYEGCMVLSYEWGSYIPSPDCRPLADALAPRAMAGVSLYGGLRDPNQNAWIHGHAPSIRVYGFERQLHVTVVGPDGEVYSEHVERQHDAELPRNLEPGTYTIEVSRTGKKLASRMFRIVDWGAVQMHPSPPHLVNRALASTAGLALRGAVIEETPSETQEVAHE